MDAQCKPTGDREILSIITDLVKALRFCRRNEAFCGNVTFSQFIILNALAEYGTLNMKRLGDILSVEKSTATRLVTPLVKQSLVVLKKGDHDSRQVILRLSEEGANIYAALMQCFLSFSRAIQEEFPNKAKDKTLKGVRLFLDALQAASAARTGTDNHDRRLCGCARKGNSSCDHR